MSFRENKVIKIVSGMFKFIVYLLLILIVFIIVIQRISGNSISLGGFRIFNVISGSMLPVYEKGDILLVKQVDINKIKEGQDLVYQGKEGQVEGRIVTHRVIQIENTENGKVFHTQGINNIVEDPIVNEDQIFGVVMYKTVILSFLNKMMYNIYMFYFMLIIPTGIIIFLEIKNIKEKLSQEYDDDED